MPALELSGQIVSFEVRRSTRARRARLVIREWSGVEVVLPASAAASEAERLLRRHSEWLLQRLAERPAPPAPLADGSLVPWRGDRRALHLRRGRGPLRELDGALELAVSDPDVLEVVARALERAARAEARRLLELAVAETASELGVQPTALAIRDQRTRWGSCTSTGRLSFSWRLVLAPPAVLHYVAVHEVCHLVERNHQPAFWALVEQLMPDYREHRMWLRKHGATLRF